MILLIYDFIIFQLSIINKICSSLTVIIVKNETFF